MAEEHKRAKGSLSEAGPKHDGHGHGPHHGVHVRRHEDGSYHVHKFHPDGRETEHAVGGGTEEENLDKVHDHMHQHFTEPEGAGEVENAGGAGGGLSASSAASAPPGGAEGAGEEA